MAPQEKEKIFLAILKNHKNQIYRISWGFTSIPEDVEDIFQEIMLNIWKGLGSFKQKSSVSTWLHKISINTCILWKKKTFKRKIEPGVLQAQHSIEIEEILAEPDTRLIQLKNAIQQLKKIDKSIILLALEGLSYNEISEIVGISTSNVGVRINRIKLKIKKNLING